MRRASAFSRRASAGIHRRKSIWPAAPNCCGSIKSSSIEYESLLERLLTQETSFFRYPAVYEALEKQIVPEVEERKFWQNPRVLRIWSAGCSTGEEPYSIAITLCEALKFGEAWEIEVLATDISRRALRHAERGLFRKPQRCRIWTRDRWTLIFRVPSTDTRCARAFEK